MSRIRRRKVTARRGEPVSDWERELWRLRRLNLRARCDPATTMGERLALGREADYLGAESQRLWRERTGRK